MAKKSKVHKLTIRVFFNKPCSAAYALSELKAEMKGQDFYTNRYDEPGEPTKFVVRGFARQSRSR